MYRMIGKTEELCLGFFVPKPLEIRCTEVGFCQDQVWGGRRFKGQLNIFGNEKLTMGVLKQSEIFETFFFFEGGWISHYTYFFSINSLRVILCHVDHSAERFTGSLDPLTFCEDNLFLQGFFIWQLLPNHLSWSLGSQRSPKTSISSCRCQSWGICTMLRFGCFGPHMVLCYMSRHDWTPGWLVTWYWTGTRKN